MSSISEFSIISFISIGIRVAAFVALTCTSELSAQANSVRDSDSKTDENAELFSEKHYVTSLNVVPSPEQSIAPNSAQQEHSVNEHSDNEFEEQQKNEQQEKLATLSPDKNAQTKEWVTNTKQVTYHQSNKFPQIKIFVAEQQIKPQFELILELLEQKKVKIVEVGVVGNLSSLRQPDIKPLAKTLAKRIGEISVLSIPPYGAKYSPVMELSYDSTRLIYEGDFDLRAMFDKQGRFLRPSW